MIEVVLFFKYLCVLDVGLDVETPSFCQTLEMVSLKLTGFQLAFVVEDRTSE